MKLVIKIGSLNSKWHHQQHLPSTNTLKHDTKINTIESYPGGSIHSVNKYQAITTNVPPSFQDSRG